MKIPTIARIPQPEAQARPEGAKVDLATLAKELHPNRDRSLDYAPPEHRPQDTVVEQVLRFGDLPTKELDDIIAAAEAEIAALKADAQVIRDAYVKHTARVVEDVKHLQIEVKTAMELMRNLRNHCGLLDNNAEAIRPGGATRLEE